MTDLDPRIARYIIEQSGGAGEPPEYGFQFFTAGLDLYLNVINEDYVSTFIKDGGSAFKMVVGVYGGGKTHFLYSVRDLAWQHNFVVSYVSLKQGESPFHRLDLVYNAIVKGLALPLTADELLEGYEKGIVSFIQAWFARNRHALRSQGFEGEQLSEELLNEVEQLNSVESISFTRAVQAAYKALINRRDEEYLDICQWLMGEGYDRRAHGQHGILHKIDKTTAFTMVRSLVQWVKEIGYSGLIVLLDEAERVPSLSTKQREQHLSNLREVIDECGQTNFQGTMIFYAVPDENFLEGRTQIYEALRQRVSTVFEMINPTGVKIELEKIVEDPIPFLIEIGNKLAAVHEVAYSYKFDRQKRDQTVAMVAEAAFEQRFGDIGYKRLFVQKVNQGLQYLRRLGNPPTRNDLKI